MHPEKAVLPLSEIFFVCSCLWFTIKTLPTSWNQVVLAFLLVSLPIQSLLYFLYFIQKGMSLAGVNHHAPRFLVTPKSKSRIEEDEGKEGASRSGARKRMRIYNRRIE